MYELVKTSLVVRPSSIVPQSQMEVFVILDVLVHLDRIVAETKHFVVISKHKNVATVNVLICV